MAAVAGATQEGRGTLKGVPSELPEELRAIQAEGGNPAENHPARPPYVASPRRETQ
jgi:hypothetical protein